MSIVGPKVILATSCFALLVSGCDSNLPHLVVDSVRPNLVVSDQETPLLIEGSFYSPVGADLSTGQQHILESFEVELGGVALDDVELISEFQLSAVIPPGFHEGDHALLVRDPLDREDSLARAVKVFPTDSSSPRVVILAPDEDECYLAGETVYVLIYVIDDPPGLVSSVEWFVSGAVEWSGERHFNTTLYEYYGTIEIDIPQEPASREIRLLVVAEDDARRPNHGSARLEVCVNGCEYSYECDDGSYCNGLEVCEDGWCVDGDPPDCRDGIFCTDDVCDEETLGCLHIPNDDFCDDLLFCTGQEICDEGVGCVLGEPPCDDNVECTFDVCEEGSPGFCRMIPDDDMCQDGVFCNGEEECRLGYGCVDGHDPCGDHFECTTSLCFESSQYCDVELDHEQCEDGDICTVDLCVKGEGCVREPATEGPRGQATCDDGLDNDCDSFIDAEDADCSP